MIAKYMSCLAFAMILSPLTQGMAQDLSSVEMVFNTPGFSGRSTLTIEDKVIEMIDQAPPRSSIHMAYYEFEQVSVAEALLRASSRGVDVRLILDGNNKRNGKILGSSIDLLLHGSEQFPALSCSEEPCVKFCDGPISFKAGKKHFGGSCHGLVINHNKFILFSELPGAKNVVVQTSANLTHNQLRNYNDLIIFRDDEVLYDGFMQYWKSLLKDDTKLTAFKTLVDRNHVKVYFFPRLIGSDPVLKLLKRVSCQIPGSMVRVSEASFTRKDIAKELQRLSGEGCDVKVIARLDQRVHSPSKGVIKALGADMKILPFKGKLESEKLANTIHTKLMLIDASIDGSPERIPVVLTGSHNLDLFSLKTNDEVLMEVHDRAIFQRYLQFWNQILADAESANIQFVQ